MLHDKILNHYSVCFKEKLEPNDRVRIKPVLLAIDKSNGIRPKHCNKPWDIPYHLCKAADAAFRAMLNVGILTKVDHATDWSSKSFPVKKPGSDPIAVRCVCHIRRDLGLPSDTN